MSSKQPATEGSGSPQDQSTSGAQPGQQPRTVDQEFHLTSHRSAYESLVNALPLCLLIKDTSGRRLFANKAYLEFRGKSADEIIGKVDADLFPAKMAELYSADDQRVLLHGETLHNIEESRDRTGAIRWIERIKCPICDDDGNITGLQLVFWDVTDRVQAREELDFERHLLNTMLVNLPDSIYFKDLESKFIRISTAMAKKFGFQSSDDVLGKTDADIFTAEHAEAALSDEMQIIETGEPLVDRIEKETWRDRNDSWCISTKMPFHDSEGRTIGTFGISRDITELVQSQKELKEARERADKANRAKSEFLANMSHEIRTPMNAITGMSELLAQTALSDEQRDYVDLVRESADSLLRLLNDILDFSRIEARKLTIESAPFNIRDLVEKTARTLAIRAGEKQLELTCRVAPDVPERLVGDSHRLRQVLINLVGNSIKFTEEGEVRIDVMLDPSAPSDASQPPVLFRVSDTGMGIPREKQAAVLQAFTQADTSTTRRYGGSGLGLAICRELVKLMQGNLWLESEPGKGTTFAFAIPMTVASDVRLPPAQRLTSLVDLEVLVVDDNSTNRRILDEILKAWQLHPTLANDGPEALRKIKTAKQTGKSFRLAVLDFMMPNMDGFELAEQIRKEHSADDMKLIILSSATHSDHAKRCSDVGVERYMTKPVVQSELLDTLLQIMGIEEHFVADTGDDPIECPAMKILVAEDGLANQHVAVGLLKAAGHQATIASDGNEAVSKWRDGDFDAILMDMHMPEMDGLEATRTIRREEQQSSGHIPIIALTAAAMEEDAIACREAGMDDYLTKPIHPRSLQLKLRQYAPADSPPACIAGQLDSPTAAEAGDVIASRDASEDLTDVVDLQAASQRVSGGLAGVFRLADIFKMECASLLEALHNSEAIQDAASAHCAAHTLKGSANLFVAKRVAEAAIDIEQHAKRGELLDLPDRIKHLEAEVEVFFRAVDQLKSASDLTA